jgi:Tfp pilus assembly protein PilF
MRHSGDLSGAIEAYRQALSLDPLSSRAERRLGVALGSAGETIEALSVLGKAIEREPNNALLWYERALIESKSGELEKAKGDLLKALQLKPDFADAQNNMGSLLAQTGDPHGAETAFREALIVNPYDSGTRANLGRLLAGEGDWKQAAFQLQRAVKLDNANFDAHADYAVALLQLNRLPEAEAEARAATASRSARAHDLLGEILLERRQMAEGQGELEAALQLDPAFGPALLDLAQLLLQQGHGAAAKPLLERAESSPVPDIAKRARAMLQESAPR